MGKNILVGIDGTGLDITHGSNVVKLIERARNGGARTIYRRGVGSSRKDKYRGGIAARGMNRLIRRTWQEVCNAYEPGDTLYVTGFSRGGAAAISLTNLMGRVGLTGFGYRSSVAHEAMDCYGARAGYATGQDLLFRDKYDSVVPHMQTLVVFDPVGALGTVWPGRLSRLRFGQHDLTVGYPANYYGLFALDERRDAFRPVLQHQELGCLSQHWVPGVHGDVGGGDGQEIAGYCLEMAACWFNLTGLPMQCSYNVRYWYKLACKGHRTESMRWPYTWFKSSARPACWRRNDCVPDKGPFSEN